MKGTAACIIWYTLLDCRDVYKHNQKENAEYKMCPGCRIASFVDNTCDHCLFTNLYLEGSRCSRIGRKILYDMEDIK